jgi:hypothetical protein
LRERIHATVRAQLDAEILRSFMQGIVPSRETAPRDADMPWLTPHEADYMRSWQRRLDAAAMRPDPLEVDYARDLDDAPTFPEALAALEAWKARRAA